MPMNPILPLALALLPPAQEPKKDVPPPAPVPARSADVKKAVGPIEMRKAAVPAAPPRATLLSPPAAPPTGPTLVAIDFKAQPIAQVIRSLAERTGGMVDTFNANDARWNDQRVTLESPAPVPFWEAVDRLAAAAGIVRSVSPSGPLGIPRAHVQFQSSFGPPSSPGSADEGLVAYVGPFRVGPVVVHEHFDRVFLRPIGPSMGAAPPSPFYAEIPLMAEPNLLAAQVGPLRRIEAVDDAGRSLLDPKLGGEVPPSLSVAGTHGPPRSLRVPLVRGEGPSKALARLRVALPLEVARRPTAPTLVIPLEGASGKTFRDGDIVITVRGAGVDPQGQAVVRLTARLEGPRGEADPKVPGLAAARLWSIYHDQIELADSQSRLARPVRDVARPAGPDWREILMDYTFPAPTVARPSPTQIRLYRPDWIAWDLPIEFRDVPLP